MQNNALSTALPELPYSSLSMRLRDYRSALAKSGEQLVAIQSPDAAMSQNRQRFLLHTGNEKLDEASTRHLHSPPKPRVALRCNETQSQLMQRLSTKQHRRTRYFLGLTAFRKFATPISHDGRMPGLFACPVPPSTTFLSCHHEDVTSCQSRRNKPPPRALLT
jgi:hypothetical protein